ncbi:MAG: hypothetical protein KJP02_02650 [Octadecabacter sp.]|nr:hypothetical protein [Octadecabacter sp.]
MKQILLASSLALPLFTVPVFAQQDGLEQEGEIEEGFSLMGEGAKLLFRGILNQMEPAIEDFTGMAQELEPALEMLASEMGPALIELMRTLDSVRYYEAPEILPNGDIIIRRSPDAPEYVPREVDTPPEDVPIDL